MEQGLRGEEPLPNALILDVDFGLDSGYELLRLWYCTRLTSNFR